MLSRYGNIDYVLNMSVEDGLETIEKAIEKASEDRAFTLYAARYAWMNQDNFVPFTDFYKPPRRQQEEVKSATEIIADVENMYNSYKWK